LLEIVEGDVVVDFVDFVVVVVVVYFVVVVVVVVVDVDVVWLVLQKPIQS